jgi:hypothetical protein
MGLGACFISEELAWAKRRPLFSCFSIAFGWFQFRQADDWWEQQQTTGEGHRLFLPNWFCQTFVSSNYAAVQFMHHRVVLLARKKSATVDCHQTLLIANLPWQNASWPLVMSILSKRFGHFVLGEFFSRLMVHHAPKKIKIHRHAT